MADKISMSDFTLIHPGSRLHAQEIVHRINFAADGSHELATIKQWAGLFGSTINWNFGWDVLMEGQVNDMNLYSRNIHWVTKELYYKWWFATGTNKAALDADAQEIKTVVDALP